MAARTSNAEHDQTNESKYVNKWSTLAVHEHTQNVEKKLFKLSFFSLMTMVHKGSFVFSAF